MRRIILDLDLPTSKPLKLDENLIKNWDDSKKERETANNLTVDSKEAKALKALLKNHKQPLTKYPKMVKSSSEKNLINKEYRSPFV